MPSRSVSSSPPLPTRSPHDGDQDRETEGGADHHANHQQDEAAHDEGQDERDGESDDENGEGDVARSTEGGHALKLSMKTLASCPAGVSRRATPVRHRLPCETAVRARSDKLLVPLVEISHRPW